MVYKPKVFTFAAVKSITTAAATIINRQIYQLLHCCGVSNPLKMKRKSLRELYDVELRKPTPATQFVREVMRVTQRRETSVRQWLAGNYYPDVNTQRILAEHFDTTPELLFPPQLRNS